PPAESEQLERRLEHGPDDERIADDEAREPERPDEVRRAPPAHPHDREPDGEGQQVGKGGAPGARRGGRRHRERGAGLLSYIRLSGARAVTPRPRATPAARLPRWTTPMTALHEPA